MKSFAWLRARPKALASAGRTRRSAGLRRPPWWLLAAGAFVVIAATVITISLPALLSAPAPAPTIPAATSDPSNPIDTLVSPPTGITGAVGTGGVLFTWKNPAPQEGDYYLWRLDSREGAPAKFVKVEQPSVKMTADPSGITCIEVIIVRSTGRPSEPARGCAP